MRIFRIFLFGFIILQFAFCSEDNNGESLLTLEDILIKDNEISGWVTGGNSWIANSSGDLSSYINGEATIYTIRGFVEAALQEYQGLVIESQEFIELRVFDQGNIDNAKSVYDEVINGFSNPVDWIDGAGEEAKVDRISSLSQRIVFYDDKYFVSLSITNGIDEALNVLKTFAINIDTKIK
jgi:hypothetical protein